MKRQLNPRTQVDEKDDHMKITVLPKTFLGKISTVMYILFLALMVLEGRLGENSQHAIILLSMVAVIILAAIIGLIAIVRNEERSIIVLLMIPLGVFHLLGFVFLILSYLS
jgi:ABC-type transport system involved in cytochrome bd biosynthesis fused ATPase/permease subunit